MNGGRVERPLLVGSNPGGTIHVATALIQRPTPTPGFGEQSMKTQKTALEYYKELLDKISFADQRVFRKELRKAFRNLVPEERAQLKHWFRTSCICRVDQKESEAILIAMERHDRR